MALHFGPPCLLLFGHPLCIVRVYRVLEVRSSTWTERHISIRCANRISLISCDRLFVVCALRGVVAPVVARIESSALDGMRVY